MAVFCGFSVNIKGAETRLRALFRPNCPSVSVGGFRGQYFARMRALFWKGRSGLEAKKSALAVPFQRNFANTHEAPGRELDGLLAGEDGLDDIGRQKGELHGAADLAGVVFVAASNLPSRPDFSSGQLAEPSMGPDE